jgi:hypothetical protein
MPELPRCYRGSNLGGLPQVWSGARAGICCGIWAADSGTAADPAANAAAGAGITSGQCA